ncbi:MAG: AbrB/MazE/SpoVT family DNA-binding domain-containing protein [Burkholderiales bacterium]|nr:AbrB/MazE/SpoVT family DNA-binding domain-containing protein [Burkholderiales bacterium]
MNTAIDRAGRVLIPKDIREGAGLTPGTPLSIRLSDGIVEICAEPLPVELIKTGRFLVAEPHAATPPLTSGLVESVRATLTNRRERSRG